MSDTNQTCEQCGAAILPEHIEKRRAGRVGGKLLCAACVTEKIREKQAALGQAGAGSGTISNSGVLAAGTATLAKPPVAKAAPAGPASVIAVAKPVLPVDSIDE